MYIWIIRIIKSTFYLRCLLSLVQVYISPHYTVSIKMLLWRWPLYHFSKLVIFRCLEHFRLTFSGTWNLGSLIFVIIQQQWINIRKIRIWFILNFDTQHSPFIGVCKEKVLLPLITWLLRAGFNKKKASFSYGAIELVLLHSILTDWLAASGLGPGIWQGYMCEEAWIGLL